MKTPSSLDFDLDCGIRLKVCQLLFHVDRNCFAKNSCSTSAVFSCMCEVFSSSCENKDNSIFDTDDTATSDDDEAENARVTLASGDNPDVNIELMSLKRTTCTNVTINLSI